MIIKVTKHGIYAMADEVSKVYSLMESYCVPISNHIAKCVIWGQRTNSFSHWVHEIATFINKIARKKTKSKLKLNFVKDKMFSLFGDEYYDAKMTLMDVYEDCISSSDPYPEVEITSDMVRNFANAYHEIETAISDYIVNHKFQPGTEDYRNEIKTILYSILDKYC